MECDRRGLPLSTGSATAAAHYRDGIERFLRGVPGARDAFGLATAEDPSFGEAHVGGAFAALYDGDTAGAGTALATATATATTGAGDRARGQIALVQALSQFDVPSMSREARPHLTAYPGDDLAREAVGLLNFFLGRSDEVIDLYEWLAPGQAQDWAFAASWSFACHEVGRLGDSQRLGELALSARPDHVFATHSLTHVAYESGRHEDGARLVTAFLDRHQPIAFQQRHLGWHLALHLLAGGHDADVRALWGSAVAPGAVPTALGSVEDGASLLWRWHLYGVGDWELPWEELAEAAREVAALPVIPLAAACAAVALAALGDEGALASLVDTADSMEAAGLPVPGSVLRAVAAAALASFAGAWGEVADALLPVRARFGALGGSRAQREVFEDALLFGLMGAGRGDEAEPLLVERVARRPSGRDERLLARLA
jgi:hypothetical protein